MRPVRLAGALQPTATQEALLRVVVAPADRLEERWRGLRSLDLDHVERGALAFLPLVYMRLSDAGIDGPLLPRLKGAYRNVWYRNQLQLERLPKVAEAAGPGAIFMRDVALSTGYYADIGLRLIVQFELMSAGGGSTTPSGAVVHAGAPRYLVGRGRSQALFEAFAERSQERTVGVTTVRTLSAGDELLVGCAAGATPTIAPAQWLLDVRQILRSGAIHDPGRVAADAHLLGLASQLREAVAYLSSIDASLEVDDLLTALDARTPTRRDRLAYRLAAAPAGRLGVFPQTLGAYLRTTRADPVVRVAATLPRHLADEWGVGLREVPLMAVRKALKTIRPGPRGPRGHSP